jgi:hypothetical protein
MSMQRSHRRRLARVGVWSTIGYIWRDKAAKTFLAACALVVCAVNPVAAITSNQANVLNEGILYYNTELSCSDTASTTSTSSVPLNGKDNLSKAMNFFIGKGLTAMQAAAIIGNMEQESGQGLRPEAVNPSSGAYGIAQWLNGRLDALKSRPGYQTLGVQLNFLWEEVSPGGSQQSFHPLEAIKADKTLEQMVTDWERRFERAGEAEANIPNRLRYAQALLKPDGASATVSSNTPVTTASSNCTNGSNSGVVTTGGKGCAGGAGAGKFIDDNHTALSENGLTVKDMCDRAHQLADPTSTLFRQWWSTGLNGACKNEPGPGPCNTGWCDYTASFVWGYGASGHLLATHNDNQSIAGTTWHWNDLLARGHGHPYDRHPPVGAFLFYNNHAYDPTSHLPSGHVVVYLGGNTVVSSDFSSTGVTKFGYVGIVAADRIESYWGQEYLGWADPLTI